MNSIDNAKTIINDKHSSVHKIVRNKNGYIVKYKKNTKFFPPDTQYHSDEYFYCGILLTVLIGGLQMFFIGAFLAIWTWFIVPIVLFGFLIFFAMNSKTTCRGDILLTVYGLVVSLLVSWAVLAGAYNDNLFNDSDGGRKHYHYVKEHVNPELLYFKK